MKFLNAFQNLLFSVTENIEEKNLNLISDEEKILYEQLYKKNSNNFFLHIEEKENYEKIKYDYSHAKSFKKFMLYFYLISE